MKAGDFLNSCILIKDFFLNQLNNDIEDYSDIKIRFKIPILPEKNLIEIIEKSIEMFSQDPILLKIKSPIKIVGDLHGHLLDLLRIFKRFGIPPNQSYLFLGDIIDRGEFSLETLILILILKILYPNQIFIIRGNHEFECICKDFGFYDELNQIYGSSLLWKLFMNLFSCLPLLAIIDEYLCVHGGIGPEINGIESIEELKRPIYNYHSPIVENLLWSDPSDQIQCYLPSNRGLGNLFGENFVTKLLNKFGCKGLIRSHQMVQEGFLYNHFGLTLTVFSASNYCGQFNNFSSVINLNNNEISIIQFQPLKYLKRKEVKLIQNSNLNNFSPLIRPPSLKNLIDKKIIDDSKENCKSLPPLPPLLFSNNKMTSRKIPSFNKIEMNQLLLMKRTTRKSSF